MVEDVHTLRLCVVLLVFTTQISSLMTFPFLIRVFNASFDSSLWGNWFRFGSYLCVCAASILTGLGVCLARGTVVKTGFGAMVTGTACVLINVIFGLRTPMMIVCSGSFAPACMERFPPCKVPSSLPGADGKGWEAFLFSLALCLQLAVLPVLIQLTYRKVSLIRLDHKVCDTESTVVVLNVSTGEQLTTETRAVLDSKMPARPSTPYSKDLKPHIQPSQPHRNDDKATFIAAKPNTKRKEPPLSALINPLFSHFPGKKPNQRAGSFNSKQVLHEL